MTYHPISFQNLADWLDGRLDAQTQQAVEKHLACGCPICEADLAWLRRVTQAARTDRTVEPPAECVARVKALYRDRVSQPTLAQRPWWRTWSPRWAMALSVLLVLITTSFYVLHMPAVFVRQAVLVDLLGSAEMRSTKDASWQALDRGARLSEGTALRVSDGVAVLTLFDGSVLQVQSGTELTFSVLRSDLVGLARRVVLNQQTGAVDYDVTPLGGTRSVFQAQSPAVLVTVRGTRFVLIVQNETETKVEVLEGRVEVANEVQTAVLEEREVAAVPANAPLIHLPTLTPLPTPTPTVTKARPFSPSPSAMREMPSAMATATPYPMIVVPTETPVPTWTLAAAETPQPTSTPTATSTATPAWLPTPRVTPTLEEVEFVGIIERLPASRLGLWQVGGRMVLVKNTTEIVGRPAVGLPAKVKALKRVHPPLEAIKIEILLPQPAETAGLPTVPGPTRTPRPTREPQPTWSPELTATPTPTHTATPEVTGTPRPTRTPEPALTPQPGQTVAPQTTRTPSTAATPAVEEINFSGIIESFPPMRLGYWVIGGQTVLVTPETRIIGMPTVGLSAQVKALRHPAAVPLRAVEIRVLD